MTVVYENCVYTVWYTVYTILCIRTSYTAKTISQIVLMVVCVLFEEDKLSYENRCMKESSIYIVYQVDNVLLNKCYVTTHCTVTVQQQKNPHRSCTHTPYMK